MTRGQLNKQKITETAVMLAEQKGLSNVTLKDLASELGVKSPSLYKHIPGGLEELYESVTVYAWKLIDDDIMRSAVGKSKDEAVRAICYAFRNAIVEHPGIFESLQWHNSYTSDVNKQATEGIIKSLYQVLQAYGLSEEQKLHILRILRGFVQGFSTIEAHGGFGDPLSIDSSFDLAVDFIINGINAMQGENSK